MKSKDLLDHMERVHDDYVDLVDKIPMEDKLIMSREEEFTVKFEFDLEPWEISEIVQQSLNDLPDGLENEVDALFDIVYNAVSEALDRARR